MVRVYLIIGNLFALVASGMKDLCIQKVDNKKNQCQI